MNTPKFLPTTAPKLPLGLSFMTALLCFRLAAQPQQAALPIGRVTYFQTTQTPGDQHYNGLSTLLFSGSQSLYTHNSAPKSDSSFSTPSFVSATVAGDVEGFPILLNFHSNVAWCKIPCPRISKHHCVVRDTIEPIAWDIRPDKRKRFGSIHCTLATGHFRGREYEVWFAPEIPVPAGPFKLGGLPGLILEAASLDGKVKFSFVEIEMPSKTAQEIQMPKGKILNMSYQAFLEEGKEFFKQLIEASRSRGTEMTIEYQETIEVFPEK